ncbi:MAG: hypothetical protein ACSHX0_01540 [Akkermansiaceae bacterium]
MEDFDFRIVVMVLFVVISAIQWMGKKMKKGGSLDLPPSNDSEYSEQSTNSGSLEDIYDQYREQIRKQQTNVEEEESTPIAIASTPPPLPPERVKAEAMTHVQAPRFQSARQTQLTLEQKEAAARFEKNTIGSTQKRQKTSKDIISVRELLSHPASAKKAVILTEILSTPKSMREDSYGY